jgi:hypothetical protein
MKKKIAVTLWKKIQPVLDKNRDLYIVGPKHNQALRLEDCQTDSDFFFEIGFQDDSNNYTIKYKPFHPSHVREQEVKVAEKTIIEKLEEWFSILQQYNEVKTPYDDPLVEQYSKEFMQDLKFTDPQAGFVSFNLNEQLLLDSYLTEVKQVLIDYKEDAQESSISEIEKIEFETQALQAALPRLTKNQTLEMLVRIWARTRRYSLQMLKDVIQEFRKEGLKAFVKGTLEMVPQFFRLLE